MLFNFCRLNYDMSWCGCCLGPSVFPDLDICFLPQVSKVSSHNFIKYMFDPFLFSWDPDNANVGMLDIVLEIP